MNNKLRRHGAAMREHAKVVAFTGRERRNEYSEEVNYRDAAASVKICKIIKPIKNKGRRKKNLVREGLGPNHNFWGKNSNFLFLFV